MLHSCRRICHSGDAGRAGTCPGLLSQKTLCNLTISKHNTYPWLFISPGPAISSILSANRIPLSRRCTATIVSTLIFCTDLLWKLQKSIFLELLTIPLLSPLARAICSNASHSTSSLFRETSRDRQPNDYIDSRSVSCTASGPYPYHVRSQTDSGAGVRGQGAVRTWKVECGCNSRPDCGPS